MSNLNVGLVLAVIVGTSGAFGAEVVPVMSCQSVMISGQYVGTDQYAMCNLAMNYPEDAFSIFCSNGGEQFNSVCMYGVYQIGRASCRERV